MSTLYLTVRPRQSRDLAPPTGSDVVSSAAEDPHSLTPDLPQGTPAISANSPHATFSGSVAQPPLLQTFEICETCQRELKLPSFLRELTNTVENRYAAMHLEVDSAVPAQNFTTAWELLRGMALLQKQITEGQICQDCALTWIEKMLYVKDMFGDELDDPNYRDWRFHPCYTLKEKVNIRNYLISMGKLDDTRLRAAPSPSLASS